MFSTKSDVENLKAELWNKISYLKQDILSETVKSPPFDSDHVSLPLVQSKPAGVTPGSLPSQVSLNDSALTILNYVRDVSACDIPVGLQARPIPEKARKIVVAGDSLLHPMNANKMSMNGISCQKLTKKVDSLGGSVYRSKQPAKQYISKHGNEHIDLVLLAGTNDHWKKLTCSTICRKHGISVELARNHENSTLIPHCGNFKFHITYAEAGY